MSGKNNIDQLVKNSFDAQEIPVNEAHWTSAQSFMQAQRKKRRRAAAYWVMGLLLLISSLGYLSYSSFSSSNEPHPNQITSNNAPRATNHTSETPQPTSGKKDQQPSSAQQNRTETAPRNSIRMDQLNGMQLTVASTDSSEQNPANTADHLEAPFSKKGKTEVSASLSFSLSAGDSSTSEPASTTTEDHSQNDNHTSSNASSNVTSSLALIEDASERQSSSELPVLEAKSPIPTADSNQVQIALLIQDSSSQDVSDAEGSEPDEDVEAVSRSRRTTDTLSKNIVHLDSMPLLDIIPFPISDTLPPLLYQPLVQLDSVLELPDSLVQDPSRNFRGFFLMPYLGPSTSFKTLSGNNEELLDKRTKEESIPIMPDIGVMARYGFSNNLYLGSGLNYYQMGENAKYSAFETVNSNSEPYQYYRYIDTGYLKYTSWDTAYLSEMQQIVYTGYRWIDRDSVIEYAQRTVYDTLKTEAREVNNRLSYIEIPFLIGYQVPMGKWSLGGDVGTGLNFLVNAQGLYPDIERAKYSPLARSDYRLLNYTFVSNLSVGRQLGQHWTLYGNIRFRNQLGSAQKPNDALAARYRSLGFQFRLNYAF